MPHRKRGLKSKAKHKHQGAALLGYEMTHPAGTRTTDIILEVLVLEMQISFLTFL